MTRFASRFSRSLAAAALMAGAGATLAGASTPELDFARRLNEAFVQVAESVSPAVVVVRVWPKASASLAAEHERMFRSLPEDVRKEFEQRLERERERRRRDPDPEQGSGVILREDGYIVTNGHVVENAERIEVRLRDGRRYPAEVRGVDSESDLAVIKVDATGLPAARMGDSARVRVGEFAIAIGAPFELEYTVTFGHVSAKGRRVLLDVVMMDQDFIQTDASINPGNSGGPLVNIEGEVIGINSMIRGMNTGIGFAVPVNLVKEVTSRLITDGRFTRAWLGVNIEQFGATPDATPPGVPGKDGVVVTRIVPDGPSWGSELKARDVIVAIDGEPVREVADLKRQVSRKAVGKPIQVGVYRGEERMNLTLTPGELPSNRLAVMRAARPVDGDPAAGDEEDNGPEGSASADEVAAVGLTVRELGTEDAERLGLERGAGVLVVDVAEGSPAAARRIRVGEAITRLNRKAVRTPEEFASAVRSADLAKGVSITIVGERGRRFEVLKDVAP